MERIKKNRKHFECPFDENKITTLLFLEESNVKARKDQNIIKKLVTTYAKLVEYYDTMKDPIKIYFMDKM